MRACNSVLARHLTRLMAGAAILLPGVASAQTTASDAGTAPQTQPAADAVEPVLPGDIIVTAQRRAERIQDVPIAITAVSSDQIAARNVVTINDLQGSVPGLSIAGFAGVNGTNLISLRGVAGQPVPIGASQATAVYLDGVYLSRPDAAFFGLQDVQRVEVLRGPQGTLYGRNATAGAINIVTEAPGDQFHGKFDVNYGNYNTYSAGAYLSGPLGGGFAASASFSANGHDGYFINTVNNRRIGDANSYTGRLKLAYRNGGFDATLSADYTQKYSQDIFTPIRLVNGQITYATRYIATDIGNQIGTHVKTQGLALTLNMDVADNVKLTSISSYRKFNFFVIYDIDGTALNVAHVIDTNDNSTFNQEVRAVYDHGGLKVTLGANYFNEKAEVRIRLNPTQLTKTQLIADPRPRAKSDLNTLAAFLQTEYDITHNLTASAGVRLNYEKRDFVVDYSTAGFSPTIGQLSDTAVLPAFGLNYKPDRNVLLYAKVSEGYQAPGFAYQPGAGNVANTFKAEKLWAYELGAKTQLLDRLLTFNVAAFYYDYKDIQLRRLISPSISVIDNVGAARVKGAEAEVILTPLRGLTLNAQATYSDATYTRFCEGITSGTPLGDDQPCTGTPVPTANRAGNALNLAPRWSGGVGFSFERGLGASSTLKLSGNYSFETKSYFTADNSPLLNTQGWHRLDARAGLAFKNGLELYVFGRNITGDRHIVDGFRGSRDLIGVVNDPATYGGGVKFRF
ncbi:TonB-dependent receptor [Sphingomonas mali]|uniref:TonB-dependent receptor n=1 Tax=Sphingomonas mali TaxID=40682 RepID=UPI000A006FF5|nr:TonB-dependent receptor [Sphingomonas mali]